MKAVYNYTVEEQFTVSSKHTPICLSANSLNIGYIYICVLKRST